MIQGYMAEKKHKILFVHHGIGIGGAPTSLLKLVLALDKNMFDVKVLFIRDGDVVQQFVNKGIAVDVINGNRNWFIHNLSGKVSWKYFLRYFGVFFSWQYVARFEAYQYLVRADFDIVHLNSHALTSWAFAAKKLGYIVVMHNREAITRGYLGLRYRILKYLINSYCDSVVCISKDNFERLNIPSKSTVVYNFLDIPRSIQFPSVGDKELKVVYLGGASLKKGFDMVVECVRLLDPNVVLFLAGHYPPVIDDEGSGFRQTIRNLKVQLVGSRVMKSFKSLQLEGRVNVLGVVSDPLALIGDCDILISPFNVPHFSRPIIEAFSLGRPVIATEIPGMDEIVDNQLNGILIPKGDYRALAYALNHFCYNRDELARMGAEGREKAERLYSHDVNIELIVNIYTSLLEDKPKN